MRTSGACALKLACTPSVRAGRLSRRRISWMLSTRLSKGTRNSARRQNIWFTTRVSGWPTVTFPLRGFCRSVFLLPFLRLIRFGASLCILDCMYPKNRRIVYFPHLPLLCTFSSRGGALPCRYVSQVWPCTMHRHLSRGMYMVQRHA